MTTKKIAVERVTLVSKRSFEEGPGRAGQGDWAAKPGRAWSTDE